MDTILIARHHDEVVELVWLVVQGAGDAAFADAQTALSIVQVTGGEIGLDIGRDDGLLPFVAQFEGRWHQMGNHTVEKHSLLWTLPTRLGISQMACQRETGIRIVNSKGT